VKRLVLTLVVAAASPAAAQPQDPPADPVDPYAPAAPTADVTVARALVARARQLLDAGFPADAVQLAEESLVRTADRDTVAEANAILIEARRRLGIAPQAVPTDVPEPVVTPLPSPPPPGVDAPPRRSDELRGGERWLGLHGSLVGAAVAGGIALAASDDSAAATSIAAAGGGVAGYLGGQWAARRWKLDETQARTIGSGSMVGAVTLGFFADVLDVDGTSAGEVGLGVGLGALAGAAGGALIARGDRLSTGDVALMDSFALYGVLGGLTLGAAMQPAETEAYSLNAVLGGIGGWLAGAGLGPKIDASPRRVSWMMVGAATLGGTPWLVYLAIQDDSTTTDEQVVGFLSTAGILGGAYLGYRWSKRLGGESRPGRDRLSDQVPVSALLRRDRGGWALGPVLPRPAAVDGNRAWLIDVAGGTF
jgi:hypothetical protein